jgi:hypothetical protein
MYSYSAINISVLVASSAALFIVDEYPTNELVSYLGIDRCTDLGCCVSSFSVS